MDRKLARRNIRMALILTTIVAIMFALSFVAAAVYNHA